MSSYLHVKRISKQFILDESQGVARSHSQEQLGVLWESLGILDRILALVCFDRNYAPHVQTVFCQSTCLKNADLSEGAGEGEGKVPTLSKQTQLTDPDTLITLEFIQKIEAFFSLDSAYSLPTVMAAGSAGGTAIVIRSSAFMAMSVAAMLRVL